MNDIRHLRAIVALLLSAAVTACGSDCPSSNAPGDFRGADLTSCDFSRANLTSLDLRETDLSGVDFSGASINSSDLDDAKLSNANFSNASLNSSDFINAVLEGANFSGAVFNSCDCSGATGADFTGSTAVSSDGCGG